MKTIRQLREERGWTQEILAVLVGVSPGHVNRWETGKRVPNSTNRLRLAILFGVSVEAIAFGPTEQAPQDRPS